MELLPLNVHMLGGFSITAGDREISDTDNRSYKVWLLLAYLIYCRSRPVTQDELTGLLWGESESCSNPANALKTMFHRVRSLLDQLGDGLGHALVVRRRARYSWNAEIPLTLDAEEFEQLCRQGAAAEEETRLAKYLKALELYRGGFLPKLSTESWVVPVSAYFSNLYQQTVHEAVLLLEQRGRTEEAVALCRRGVAIEPYDEFLYLHLLRELLDAGEQKEAAAAYEAMAELLFSHLGVMPSDDLKALYREALRSLSDREVSPGIVRDQLREPGYGSGALFCDYDFFKAIYHAEARGVARSGVNVHFALLSVAGETGRELPRQSLNHCMENLQDVVLASLRKGDIVSRCSISQFILLLPQANYEDSCTVLERIRKSYARQYPHSPARLRFTIQPLEPNL